jgi:hypothetical protein
VATKTVVRTPAGTAARKAPEPTLDRSSAQLTIEEQVKLLDAFRAMRIAALNIRTQSIALSGEMQRPNANLRGRKLCEIASILRHNLADIEAALNKCGLDQH